MKNIRWIFVDWLHLQQKYVVNEPLPRINGSVIIKVDENGEQVFEVTGYREHLGSFDTRVNVRCDGFTVEVSGNPSRYSRLDNVFGFKSLHKCLDIYNQILNAFGLPSMNKGSAIIKRIDITENYMVGKGKEQEYIRLLSSCIYNGELAKLYPDFNTCTWFESSKRLIIKAYNKSHELKRHLKKLAKIDGVTARELQYIKTLIHQAEQVGIVRIETGFRKKLLKDVNLDKIKRRETMGELIELFENRNPFNQKNNYNLSESTTVYDKAIELGYSTKKSENIRDYYDLYLTGVDFKQRYQKRSTYFRICSTMKSVGVDVRKPLDVTRLQYVSKPLDIVPLLPSDEYIDFVPNLKFLSHAS
jgi:II/X family phage/plasmid replication protein